MARKAEYGRGHKVFLDYIQSIVTHPNYAGMPDVYLDDGTIQWEAPSNRSPGKFQFTHQRRLEWWRKKAVTVSVDTNSSHWISRVAKIIHPTKRKPCKRCGRELDIRYVYPSSLLVKRLDKTGYFNETFPLDPLEDIQTIISRLHQRYASEVFATLPILLSTKSHQVPTLPNDLNRWLVWVESTYIPSEPKTLSPGVMSNPPDRFDGFHSFNRCCREVADKGRSKQNLRSYTTDRRVFEYWVDGNWVAADRMMGLIRSLPHIQQELCLNGHSGPCQADHVGPISLGFAHRPEFQLLCRACNSAKNNRMSLKDVTLLRQAEQAGAKITSWYCQNLWTACQSKIQTDEQALRLSKLLRDNRHTFMTIIKKIADDSKFTFLLTFLGLEYATKEPYFHNLRIEHHVTKFDAMIEQDRGTKYVIEQKARRIRVAFTSLVEYFNKDNRNEFVATNKEIDNLIQQARLELARQPDEITLMDNKLELAITQKSEEQLRQLAQQVPHIQDFRVFVEARSLLECAIALIAEQLLAKWDDPRYVREYEADVLANLPGTPLV